MLEQINNPHDLCSLSIDDLNILAEEIRELIITIVSQNGGHLASSLGAVELTIVLHYVFDTPKDKLIWDVGHQTYAHKILTERKNRFHTLRQYGGISGFPKTEESIYDCFNTGHSSTSISAGLGMAVARDLKGTNESIIAVIGDGALSAGLAYEGLNNAGIIDTNLIVVLNDNKMSISPTVGIIAYLLSKKMSGPIYSAFRKEFEKMLKAMPVFNEPFLKFAKKLEELLKFFSPGLLFEEFGFKYFGPIKGHNISELIGIFNNVKKLRGPILVHVITEKGKGYEPAEKNPSSFHGVGKFNVETGEILNTGSTYSSSFAEALMDEFDKDKTVVAITAAMLTGTGLDRVKEIYPDRVFDVGIAEQHAVTFSAGLAIRGMKPIVVIYSTFLQRAYDQVIHDVALQRLNVTFAIDRAGLVGEDGETHHGVFDLSYLRVIPHFVLAVPKDIRELKRMLHLSLSYNGPFAFRYPRGKVIDLGKQLDEEFSIGKAQIINKGKDIVILTLGNMVEKTIGVVSSLKKENINPTLVNVRFVKPLDEETILDVTSRAKLIIIAEENACIGGLGDAILEIMYRNNIDNKIIKHIAVPDRFIKHGETEDLRKECNMTEEYIYNIITNWYKEFP
ncbi:MAG: 1-deoxy-D-xylulose-5-phosphate synthase [Deltaproteobacteria bacterium]|nr:1-deoxy-D-xylulose-5-phosphate synthase [Deltaproteobacteria bacterium]